VPLESIHGAHGISPSLLTREKVAKLSGYILKAFTGQSSAGLAGRVAVTLFCRMQTNATLGDKDPGCPDCKLSATSNSDLPNHVREPIEP
jgi:hypothetical protein